MLGISYDKEDHAIILLSELVLDMDQERCCLQNSDLRGRTNFLPASLPPLWCHLNSHHHVTGCSQAPSGHTALCQKQSQQNEPTSFFAWQHDLLITY